MSALKPEEYTISLQGVNRDREIRQIGERAKILSSLEKIKPYLPSSFILTSNAFDAFLASNKLLDIVSEKLADTDPSSQSSIEKTAHQLEKLLSNAKLPAEVKSQLQTAYLGLNRNRNALINLSPSGPNAILTQSLNKTSCEFEYLEGIEQIEEAVKYIYMQFFSAPALTYRYKAGYKGYLGTAIMIQEILPAEKSGKSYSLGINGNTELIEIEAIFGNTSRESLEAIIPDKFWLDKKTENIIRKFHFPQAWMHLIKSGDAENPAKVSISNQNRNKEKLSEIFVGKIARLTERIADHLQSHIALEWIIHSGKIFITDVKPLSERDLLEARELEKYRQDLLLNLRSKRDIFYDDNQKQVREEISLERITVSDLNDLTRLISGVGNKRGIVFGNTLKLEDEIMESYSHTIFIADKITSSDLNQLGGYVAGIVNKTIEPDLVDQINIPIVHGAKVAGNLIRTGEIITVDSDRGYVYLGAGEIKEIPVAEESGDFVSDYVMNKLRAPIEHPEETELDFGTEMSIKPDQKEQADTAIPKAPSDKNGSQLDTGLFYKSASQVKELKHNPPSPQPDTVKVNLLQGNKISHELEQAAKQEGNKQMANTAIETEEAESVQSTPATPSTLIPKTEDKKTPKAHKLIKTKTDVWQVFRPAEPIIDYLNITGLLIDFADFYQLLDLNCTEIINDKTVRGDFVDHMYEYLKETVEQVQDRTIILQASGINSTNQNLEDRQNARAIITESDLFEIELDILKKTRNKGKLKNIWFSIPGISTEDELSRIKKFISAKGLRRSSTFKIIAELSTALSAISINDILAVDIDGILINLDDLVLDLYHQRSEELSDNIVNFTAKMVEKTVNSKASPYLLSGSYQFSEKHLQTWLKKGLSNLILPYRKLVETKLIIAENEVKQLEKKAKRGRKPKEIDYGF